MPTIPASLALNSFQWGPSRPSTWAASNHEFVVGDSARSLASSTPLRAMIVQNWWEHRNVRVFLSLSIDAPHSPKISIVRTMYRVSIVEVPLTLGKEEQVLV